MIKILANDGISKSGKDNFILLKFVFIFFKEYLLFLILNIKSILFALYFLSKFN